MQTYMLILNSWGRWLVSFMSRLLPARKKSIGWAPRVSLNVVGKRKICLSVPLGSKPIFLNLAHSLIAELLQFCLIYISLLPLPFEEVTYLRFKVLTTVGIKIMVLWDVTLCRSVGRYRHFGETCCLHHLHLRWRWQVPSRCWSLSTTQNSVTSEETWVFQICKLWPFDILPCLLWNPYSFILKLKFYS
jgi:hypothetical protein